MDAVFHLDGASRAEFLRLLMQSTGCTYICLWSFSFLEQTNCLIGWDGCYNEENTRPAALGLFLEYRRLIFHLQNVRGLVPGFAFRNNQPYIELKEPELQNRASNQTQSQFYREAGIKVCFTCLFRTAVFMACRSGEIEIGSSSVVQLNMEMQMRSFLSGDFCRQLSAMEDQLNMPSSSSSSLRSLSTSSPDSSLIFTVPATHETAIPSSFNDPTQAMQPQAFSQTRYSVQLPALDGQNEAIKRAILAVLTSPSSSSSSSSTPLHRSQNLAYNYLLNPKASAFKRYATTLGGPTKTPARASLRAQTMMKRAILFYRKFNSARREQLLRSRQTPQTSNQLLHMISERKRREKLNESFTALRSLLPSGTKRDKASVLTTAREYLTSLKAQIMELSRQNQLLEAQLLPSKGAAMEVNGSSNERVNVRVVPVSESTSEQRLVDLRVSVEGERTIVDILIHVLEFLKLDRNVNLMSIEANTNVSEFGSVNLVNLRLRIEGNVWDESTFQEAVRRLITDLTQ
ncbi:hypothetical protein like AT5G56960 [Hibiscus trionum]|uniref:BHLH domain-containing protein n=1 Tax=Hibiscus trionum TaxID=183268 RepID=A0A9W7IDH4_HIBTR|nr:hypothetical protein like AT5G56960 [Hibiscus trionum]